MRTYFIRHTNVLSVSDETRMRLIAENRIGIFFEAVDSLDPSDYPTRAGKKAVRIFAELATNGGYVCAEFSGRSESLIGKVPPDSKVEPFDGEWQSGVPCRLKTLVVQSAIWLSREDYLILGVSRPIQGTLARWHAAGESIAALVEGREQAFAWASLPPARQEIACSELLRLPEAEQFGLPRLRCLLLPSGRTMRDIDLVGIGFDGRRIFAQVTFLPLASAESKINKLLAYGASGESHLLIFCRCENSIRERGITIFPVQKVFDLLSQLDWGKALLKGEAPKKPSQSPAA